MSLQEWLERKATQPQELNPVEAFAATVRAEHSGSGMRNHLSLLPKTENADRKCFCNLKKYGLDVFNPAKMPLSWIGCGACK